MNLYYIWYFKQFLNLKQHINHINHDLNIVFN
jgi:hypothetical protein